MHKILNFTSDSQLYVYLQIKKLVVQNQSQLKHTNSFGMASQTTVTSAVLAFSTRTFFYRFIMF